MPKKDSVYVRGVWEREKGSGVWWIRYRAEGILKREKVGSKQNAIDLLRKRKNDIRAGIKMPREHAADLRPLQDPLR